MDKTNHDQAILAEAERWRSRDLDVLWHPCTQMREHPDTLPLLPVASGDGAWLVGPDGRVAHRFLGPVSALEIEEAIAAAGGPAVADPQAVTGAPDS